MRHAILAVMAGHGALVRARGPCPIGQSKARSASLASTRSGEAAYTRRRSKLAQAPQTAHFNRSPLATAIRRVGWVNLKFTNPLQPFYGAQRLQWGELRHSFVAAKCELDWFAQAFRTAPILFVWDLEAGTTGSMRHARSFQVQASICKRQTVTFRLCAILA